MPGWGWGRDRTSCLWGDRKGTVFGFENVCLFRFDVDFNVRSI